MNDIEFHIMAQGEGSRWGSVRDPAPTEYKQLLPIGDETIITRTLRQLDGYKVQVIAYPEFVSHVPASILRSLSEPTGALLRGIWMIAQEWTAERNVVLLGDVVFSNKFIETIVEEIDNFNIYGRFGKNKVTGKEAWELFGFSVSEERREQVLDTISSLHNRREVQVGMWTARLWDLFHATNGSCVISVDDYTDDIDSVQEYKEFFGTLASSARQDDITWRGK